MTAVTADIESDHIDCVLFDLYGTLLNIQVDEDSPALWAGLSAALKGSRESVGPVETGLVRTAFSLRRRRDRAVFKTVTDANAEDGHGLAVSGTSDDECRYFRPNRHLATGEDVHAGGDPQSWIRKRETRAARLDGGAHPATVEIGHRARRRIEHRAI